MEPKLPLFLVRSRARLTAFAVAAVLAAIPFVSQAAPITTVTVSPYGLPAIGGSVTAIDLTGDVGLSSVTVNPGPNSVTVTTAGGGQIVQGSLAGQYAAPVTGGTVSNPILTTAPYLSTETGTITLSFAQAKSYLGLLWGSVGSGDELDLFNGSALVATITGTQIMNAASSFNSTNGAQGFGGSQYTLVNVSGGTFNKAVLSQNVANSFEASNFEYSASNQSVPEPASMALLGAGVLGLGVARRITQSA